MAGLGQRARSIPVFCHRCGERCGTEWVEDGFQWRDGPGDLYPDERDNWHCSQACLDACGTEHFARLPGRRLIEIAAVLITLDLAVLRACIH